MLFVDGENFTIRAQEVAQRNGISLTEGDYYKKVYSCGYRNSPQPLISLKFQALQSNCKNTQYGHITIQV